MFWFDNPRSGGIIEVSQQFTDPLRLERALSQGVTVVAAHCGTCAFSV